MRTPDQSPSRRKFIRGDWSSESGQAKPVDTSAEIVSLIVNAWPAHLAEVEAAIVALGNAEVHARDSARGKIVVVLEAPTQSEIGFKANAISGLPHVLSSVMVFQASDEVREVG